MEDQELLRLWKKQENKIDELLNINSQLLKEQISQKARKALVGLKAEKVLGIVTGAIYILFLGALLGIGVAATPYKIDFFVLSIGAIFLVNLKVFIDYIRHLVMVSQINFERPVADIQEQLLTLKLSLINSTRFVVLQIPFYTTWHLSNSWFPNHVNPSWVIIQYVITGLFACLAVFLFWYIKPKNAGKKWVKWVISSAGISHIEKSLIQLQELKDFKADS